VTDFDPRRVQHALVCMHFDPEYAAAVRGHASLPELGARERELLRDVDPRALATDALRRDRAVHAIVDEYPVTAALLGLDVVDRFFSSRVFRSCVFERGSMALAFGRGYLDGHRRAQGVGAIETAMAMARRGDETRVPGLGELVCAPGVEPVVTAVGMLAFYERVRQRLGAQPLETLARRRKPWSETAPKRGREYLLIEAKPDGSLALGTGSRELVELLCAASVPRPRDELASVAVTLGAEPSEADELLDDLVGDGLLRGHLARPEDYSNAA
jgi:hypothetical protein